MSERQGKSAHVRVRERENRDARDARTQLHTETDTDTHTRRHTKTGKSRHRRGAGHTDALKQTRSTNTPTLVSLDLKTQGGAGVQVSGWWCGCVVLGGGCLRSRESDEKCICVRVCVCMCLCV